jgi:hypothetical protein
MQRCLARRGHKIGDAVRFSRMIEDLAPKFFGSNGPPRGAVKTKSSELVPVNRSLIGSMNKQGSLGGPRGTSASKYEAYAHFGWRVFDAYSPATRVHSCHPNATALRDGVPTSRASGKSGDNANDSIVVRDGVDPSTSGFSDRRSTD